MASGTGSGSGPKGIGEVHTAPLPPLVTLAMFAGLGVALIGVAVPFALSPTDAYGDAPMGSGSPARSGPSDRYV